jgi:hypothetical protein
MFHKIFIPALVLPRGHPFGPASFPAASHKMNALRSRVRVFGLKGFAYRVLIQVNREWLTGRLSIRAR